jgi:hypothetical protein
LSVNADKAVLIFKDPTTRGHMLELRIGGESGAQTVFPGSTHKDTGETIAWEESGEPSSVDGADLARRIHDLAAYSLIARYWPAPGLKARHDAALIVGGFLARAGKSPQEIKIAAEAIARAINDPEWRNRRDAAEDAAMAFDARKHAYGLTEMRKQFGREVADQIAAWLGYDGSGDCAPETSTKPETKSDWRANVVSAADLEHKTFAKLVEIVPKLLVEGLTILAGRPKVGKSWKALDLSLGVAGTLSPADRRSGHVAVSLGV